MQKIQIVYTDNPSEIEAVFIDGKIVAAWYLSDASWRGEYFNGFMGKLGIEVDDYSRATSEQIESIKDWFNLDEDELLYAL